MSRYLDEPLVLDSKKGLVDPVHPNETKNIITNKTDLTIFNALRENQPATRMQLCDKTGIARTTIYDALTRLMVKKMVFKYSPPVTKKGRPKVFYRTISE
ncbi:MAG: winged helix-turn-helix transcriptional regulator [Promethearchaeota archaeon]|jgi:predicted transcriptional regulator